MGYSGQIFHFNAYSTRIPHAAVLGRKNNANFYSLILKIHNKKISVLRRNYWKTKKDGISLRIFRRGPSVEIRTQGLLNPIQARYQTSPHPDMYFAVRQLCYITTPFSNLQALIWNFSKNFSQAAAFSLTTVGGYGILYPAFGIETGRFHTRRDGWVVESTGLENRRCESIRGFESHSLRQFYSVCRSTQVAEGAPLLRE